MQPVFPEGAEAAMVIGPILFMIAVMIIVGFVIACVICFLISGCFKRIPQQYREMEPPMVWLLLIPCFQFVWNFFVWTKLAKSYKAYFDSAEVTDVGDCGYNLNLAYCIVTVCCLIPIPCIGTLLGLASLVLLIICLVKAMSLKNRIPESPTMDISAQEGP